MIVAPPGAPARPRPLYRTAGRRHRAPQPVTLLDVVRPDRTRLLVAVSRSHPGKGYELTALPDGRFACACPGYGWRGDCEHTAAASEHVRRTRTTPAQEEP